MAFSYQQLAVSDQPIARRLRHVRRALLDLTLPAPRAVVRPALWAYVGCRGAWHFLLRVVIAEPLFKAQCARYGKRVRTGIFVHWIQGRGSLLVGDDVLVDGKCSITFAARYCAQPTLEIGDRSGVGHNCMFTVGKRISIGRDCRIASGVLMFDSGGHPVDPRDRKAGMAAPESDVKPIVVGDNVWIGRGAMILPGVNIGENSIVSAGAVVVGDVPANTVVSGNPARRVAALSADQAG